MAEERNEHNLIQLLKRGDVAAFDSLFEVYSPRLFGFAMKYFKNEADSEELVQEVFLKVWGNRNKLKTELSFKSYLFTIALNQIRKYFNKKATSLRYLESLQNEPEFVDNQAILDEDYELAFKHINLIIEQMPPRRREIFMKSKLEGKSSKLIADELNISPGTVDNQVSEALRFLRSRLGSKNIVLVLFAVLFVY